MVHHSVLFNINGAALVPNFQFGFSLMRGPATKESIKKEEQ
jgi:hypothetical protein